MRTHLQQQQHQSHVHRQAGAQQLGGSAISSVITVSQLDAHDGAASYEEHATDLSSVPITGNSAKIEACVTRVPAAVNVMAHKHAYF